MKGRQRNNERMKGRKKTERRNWHGRPVDFSGNKELTDTQNDIPMFNGSYERPSKVKYKTYFLRNSS